MKNLMFLLGLLLAMNLFAQESPTLEYYFPDQKFNSEIPTPQEIIGFVPGEWHVSHDRLILYMKTLAKISPRISLKSFARSHEGRELLALIITSQENHSRIDELKKAHNDFIDNPNTKLSDEVPTVLYQGYSVHGNESSGANAALLYAYYLAAAEGPEIEKLLENQIILLDPCYNPDGLNRFSTWANMHKSKFPSGDDNNREFNEPWPRGRTNHYWFDLNRDWLLLVHPESRGRVAMFHEWRPNILTDHHEMGSDKTFFFQPGIPTRVNPMTPKINQELTGEVAKFHAIELDKIGSQYYSQESYDDFYYGKGSTYPDVNGCVGILFEQASSRGHYRETINGILTFPFTVRNQLVTSISTLKAGANLRNELLDYQQKFFQNAQKIGRDNTTKAFAVGSENDPGRLDEFKNILAQHQIEVFRPEKGVKIKGKNFARHQAIVIPTDQRQFKLIKAIFETQTSFTDSLFYDVSAWNLAMAHDLDYAELDSRTFAQLDLKNNINLTKKSVSFQKSNYGYVLDWRNYKAAVALYQLQKAGLLVRLATESANIKVNGSLKEFPPGTLFVPLQNQPLNGEEIYTLLQRLAATETKIYSVDSGLTPDGIDLGSPNFPPLKIAKALMIIGDGVSSYDAGEIWHLFDTKLEMPITMVEGKDFGGVDMDNYTTLIIPDGNPKYLAKNSLEKIKGWVKAGGTIVGFQNSTSWLNSNDFANLKVKTGKTEKNKSKIRPYSKAGADRGSKFVGGAIFKSKIDLSHPLCFGFENEELPLFHQGTTFYEYPKSPYAAPVRYASSPLLAGYISDDNLNSISNSSAIICSRVGAGRSIAFSFNPVFRGYWRGTERLLVNALFFGNSIKGNTCESTED